MPRTTAGDKPYDDGHGDEPEAEPHGREAPDESDWTPEDAPELCPACGADVYPDAPRCPECGEWIVEPDAGPEGASEWRGRPWWWIVLAALGTVMVVWMLMR